MPQDEIVAILRREFDRRREKNPSFSLRSFAQFLGISATAVSQILQGKRRLSPKAAAKVAESCKFSPDETSAFLALAAGVNIKESPKPYRSLTSDEFAKIGDWHFVAILALFQCGTERLSAEDVVRRLGIGLREAQDALKTLADLDILVPAGRFYLTKNESLTTDHDIPNEAIRRYHKQILGKVIQAIDSVDTGTREIAAITLAVKKDKISEAKKAIRDFLKKMDRLLETDHGDEVYNLEVAFIPLTNEQK